MFSHKQYAKDVCKNIKFYIINIAEGSASSASTETFSNSCNLSLWVSSHCLWQNLKHLWLHFKSSFSHLFEQRFSQFSLQTSFSIFYSISSIFFMLLTRSGSSIQFVHWLSCQFTSLFSFISNLFKILQLEKLFLKFEGYFTHSSFFPSIKV